MSIKYGKMDLVTIGIFFITDFIFSLHSENNILPVLVHELIMPDGINQIFILNTDK